MYKNILLKLFLFSAFTFAQPKMIKVPEDYQGIQLAINASNNGDTIVVSPGLYLENINFRGKEILLTSEFIFDKDFNTIKSTIINGGRPSHSDTASVVIFAKQEPRSAVLQGFTITGGKGTKTYNSAEATYFRTGGGILIDRSSPTIRYNIITKNEAINKSSVSGAGGGGIRTGRAKAIIQNNIIKENHGGYAGGVMFSFSSGTVFRNNLVINNIADGDFGGGGGIYVDYEDIKIHNCTIVGNHSDGSGSAMVVTGVPNPIVNSILYNNTSQYSEDQIFLRFGGSVSITYSNIMGGFEGEGNINSDPGFNDQSYYYLSSNSVCVDAGSPDVNYSDPVDPVTDQVIFPSLGTNRNDMGTYGGPNRTNYDNPSLTSIESKQSVTNQFQLEQNYPNPFNPETIISYKLTPNSNFENEHVVLSIYNQLGEEIVNLVNENQSPGNYIVTFNGENLSSGIYLYRLTTDHYSSTKKMVLLK